MLRPNLRARRAPATTDNRHSFISESLEPRMMLSTVQLIAGGFEGTEQMELQIDEVAVQQWTLNNTGAEGNFDTFTFESPDTISADQVRVQFLNDQWDPANNIDSNIRLDAIVIDGVRFETEAPEVFSTGTWLPGDGIQPGFRLSEILHTNGYFQFAGDPVDPPGDGEIVINEIHYNPGPDGVVDSDAEFVELYNPGDTAVDLSGMSFTGFTLTFAAGTSLGAGQYAIVSPSISIAESTWGVTPIAEFASGGISGGGETIQLLAADGVTVIDEVTYDDASPWPGAPDGNGPSLELLDPTLDNSVATSWATSIGDPTPAAQNSVFGNPSGDLITNVTVNPGLPLANQAFTISANIEGATTANLIYKVGFNGADVSVAMTNLGGDLWEGTVPGQSEGELVRYRIESDVASAPVAGDTIDYLGVVVSPSDIVNNSLPLFQFFVDDAQFEELTTTDLALTNTRIPTVVAWNGQVIDNATVRVRGGDFSRTNFPKKSLKFEMPDGYTLDFGTGYGVDEFGVNADFSDWTFAATDIAWDVWNEQSVSQTQSFNMRVENNGDFHGVFRFQELYDGSWRDANGHADNEFFKADGGGFGINPEFDKKDPDDENFETIGEINDVLYWLPFGSEAQAAWLYENVDIPSVINHMALTALTRHDDQPDQNFYMAQDTDTGLWTVIEWDLDRLWIDNEDTPTDFTDVSYVQAELMDAVFAVPEFEQMYWRRMQTIADTYLSPEGQAELIARREELIEEIGATNSTLEFEKWGRVDIYISDYFRDEWTQVLAARETAFANEIRMPGSASGNTNIVINELHYNPDGDDAEFIELFNNSNESIDLSGWEIDGIGLTIGFGTVILPNQTIVFTDNMAQFRKQYPDNIYVGGQYSGGLSGGGETVTLFDADGNTVDEVTYDDADPWPTTPDGDGFTLSLIDPNLDNDVATNWTASAQLNGTPGNVDNSIVDSITEIKIYAAGTNGDEILRLDIAGQEAAVYVLSAFGGQPGDLGTRDFIELTYTTTLPITADDVRINFLNDIPDPDSQTDRDLGIDRIEINGNVYQTEHPSVFSTGTYSDGGLIPGFWESEVLQTGGYFQYAETGAPDPTTITIYAAGSTANEIITLEIAGQVVATYDIGTEGGQAGDLGVGNFIPLSFTSNGPINAADVRINFTNDLYDEANGIDYNVAIDRIEIGGVSYETEAPTTYSTGTWLPGIGVVPGFPESQLLTSNGYFQYLFDPGANNNPTAVADSFDSDGSSVSGNLLTNDSDPDGDSLSIDSNTDPANGTVNVSSNGDFTYTPNAGFDGTDTFTYNLIDGAGGSATGDVTITVAAASLFANGNIIQFSNVQYGSQLRGLGSDAFTWNTNGTDTHWEVINPDGDNQFQFRNVANGRYLDGDQNDVDTTSNNSNFGSSWEMREINPGQYHIYNVAYNRIVDANGVIAAVAWDPAPPESDDLWTINVVSG